MKRILFLFVLMVALACEKNNSNESDRNSSNAEENVDANSGDNISPQLQDSADRLKVDTISSAASADKQKKNDLDK